MKRTISKLLSIATLAITSIALLGTASQGQASEVIITQNNVVCKKQTGGTYPLNGHYFFCGLNTTDKQTVINATTSLLSSFPSVAADMSAKGVDIYIFKNAIEDATYFDGSQSAAQQLAIYNSFTNVRGETRINEVPAYRRSIVYEDMADGLPVYPHYTAQGAGRMIRAVAHELGHQFDRGSVWDSEQVPFKNFVARDQKFMDDTAVSPTASALRAAAPEIYDPTSVSRIKWHDVAAQEFAIRVKDVTGLGDSDTSDGTTAVPYFSCSRAFIKGKMSNPSQAPTKADFDFYNTAADPNVYARCVAPFVPTGCAFVTSSGSYPYQFVNGVADPAATGWYVFCGINPTRFQTRSGDKLLNLPTSNPPQWRQKFQLAGYSLYVFRDVAQAVSLLGSAAVPSSAQVAGVLGFTQPQILGNATQPFIAMFEQVKQTNGTYVEHPNTNDLFNYDSGLYRESGRFIDQLASSSGSVSSAFRTRITSDITRFNARNGCATSGPDSTLWGSLKTTICDTSGNKKAPYIGVANLAIVRGLTVAQLGSGAVKFPPDYQAMFADVPAASNFSLIWAELIGYKRAAGNRGNDFAAMDVWVNTIYTCGKAYAADGYYINAVAPTAACP